LLKFRPTLVHGGTLAWDCRGGLGRCDHGLVPDDKSVEAVPARVVEAYDQMMRRVIGPALRQFGFTGTVREFKYGSRSQFGVVAWQKDGRDVVRAQILRFTANVNYWCGADRIGGHAGPRSGHLVGDRGRADASPGCGHRAVLARGPMGVGREPGLLSCSLRQRDKGGAEPGKADLIGLRLPLALY
jgi:hypothetical protein